MRFYIQRMTTTVNVHNPTIHTLHSTVTGSMMRLFLSIIIFPYNNNYTFNYIVNIESSSSLYSRGGPYFW